MNELAMKIKHPKRRGEWAELKFMAAAEQGLCVTMPWGETAQYDFVVEHKGRFVRVQVKSTGFKDRGGYSCSVRGSRGAYVGDPFDFVAIYVVLEDVWFVIPEAVVHGRWSVAVYPGLKKSKYGRYRENWEALKMLSAVSYQPSAISRQGSQSPHPISQRARDKGGAPSRSNKNSNSP